MSSEVTIVNFSANESNLLNLKVGRCVSACFDEVRLLNQILETGYDICRLTVSSTDEEAVAKLEKTGLPYYYSGSITRYKTPIADLPDRAFMNANIEYEQYDGTQNDLLLNMLIGTWGTYPIGYYRTPFLRQLVTKEQEILCVFEFYRKNNLQKDFPNNTIMFMKHKGNYVGFFALNIIEDRLESHIGGILDPYREGGYFYDTQEYMRRYCILHNLKYFAFGARNENRRVNAIFQKFGYRATDSDNVFHIAPLLSCSGQKDISESEITIETDTREQNYEFLLKESVKARNAFLNGSAANYTFKMNELGRLLKGRYKITFSFPADAPSENMMVIKIYDLQHKLVSFGYLYAT